jgi:hypothetical protein
MKVMMDGNFWGSGLHPQAWHALDLPLGIERMIYQN